MGCRILELYLPNILFHHNANNNNYHLFCTTNFSDAKAMHADEKHTTMLNVVFHCQGEEDSLSTCSSSVIKCLSNNAPNFLAATVKCGGTSLSVHRHF